MCKPLKTLAFLLTISLAPAMIFAKKPTPKVKCKIVKNWKNKKGLTLLLTENCIPKRPPYHLIVRIDVTKKPKLNDKIVKDAHKWTARYLKIDPKRLGLILRKTFSPPPDSDGTPSRLIFQIYEIIVVSGEDLLEA